MLKAEVNGTHVTVEMHGSGLTPYADVMRLLLSVYDGLENTMNWCRRCAAGLYFGLHGKR